MSIFRSEKMILCRLILHQEVAFHTLVKMGNLKMVHFNDLNKQESATNSQYKNEIRRCDEILKNIQYLQGEIDKYDIGIKKTSDNNETPKLSDLSEIETLLLNVETELKDVSKNYDEIKNDYLELQEKKAVLLKTNEFFGEEGPLITTDSVIMAFLTDASSAPRTKALNEHEQSTDIESTGYSTKSSDSKLEYFTGTIERSKFFSFEKALWRTCYSNFYMKNSPMNDIGSTKQKKHSKDSEQKQIFIIFFKSNQIKTIITKICQGYNVNLHSCPGTIKEREELLKTINVDIDDLKTTVDDTDLERQRILVECAQNLDQWKKTTEKIKAIYFTLNRLEADGQYKYLYAECWVPECHFKTVNNEISQLPENSFQPILMEIPGNKLPPTYFRTNKLTNPYQHLTNTYGVPTYRELNPSVFAIITFPFLFAVMFGDIGHGILILLFAGWMIVKEKSFVKMGSENEVWLLIFGGRYLILLMGLFSIYAGFIYNSLFGVSVNIFGSQWKNNLKKEEIEGEESLKLNPSTSDFVGTAYMFGIDSVWSLANNNIIFFNSFKMKMSIILGVLQMLLGQVLNAINFLHFKNYSSFFFIFLPQMLFLSSIFVYLAFLIVLKWIIYSAENTDTYSESCAPSILITFIDMCLFKSPSNPKLGCSDLMYPLQDIVQLCLMIIALCCIPVLFFGKICVSRFQRKKVKGLPMVTSRYEPNQFKGLPMVTERYESNQFNARPPQRRKTYHLIERVDMSELYIHQGILVIEVVLGSISHTASYLRLWALSLAHEQLSKILFEMVFLKPLELMDEITVPSFLICFIAWSVLTLCILVLMEGLSAFLHTLRLHWVEFQSKFYEGGGYLFEPFAFTILKP